MLKIIPILSFLVIPFYSAQPVNADTVRLKDGRKFKGEVTEEADGYVVKTMAGNYRALKSEVLEITKDDGGKATTIPSTRSSVPLKAPPGSRRVVTKGPKLTDLAGNNAIKLNPAIPSFANAARPADPLVDEFLTPTNLDYEEDGFKEFKFGTTVDEISKIEPYKSGLFSRRGDWFQSQDPNAGLLRFDKGLLVGCHKIYSGDNAAYLEKITSIFGKIPIGHISQYSNEGQTSISSGVTGFIVCPKVMVFVNAEKSVDLQDGASIPHEHVSLQILNRKWVEDCLLVDTKASRNFVLWLRDVVDEHKAGDLSLQRLPAYPVPITSHVKGTKGALRCQKVFSGTATEVVFCTVVVAPKGVIVQNGITLSCEANLDYTPDYLEGNPLEHTLAYRLSSAILRDLMIASFPPALDGKVENEWISEDGVRVSVKGKSIELTRADRGL